MLIYITIIIVLIILVLVGVIVAYVAKKKKKEGVTEEINYKAFFILGICFLPIGIVFMIVVNNPGFIGITALGLFYMTMGLANKDKWKKNE